MRRALLVQLVMRIRAFCQSLAVGNGRPDGPSMTSVHVAPGTLGFLAANTGSNSRLDALLRHYDVLQHEKRLWMQAMIGTLGVVIPATVALIGFAAQADAPEALGALPLALLMANAGVITMRMYVLRLASYLALLERYINESLGAPPYFAWDRATAGSDDAAYGWSPLSRRAPALSIQMFAAFGVSFALLFVVPGTVAVVSSQRVIDFALSFGINAEGVRLVYLGANAALFAVVVVIWRTGPRALQEARRHFADLMSTTGGPR